MSEFGKELIRQCDKAFNSIERINSETQWELITEFTLPTQSGKFITKEDAPGQKRTERVFDSTAIQANHDLSSAIHSTLTNPATSWSKLRYTQANLNEDDEATEWLEAASNTIHTMFNNSNFDNEISKGYKLFTSIGNMALFHEEREVNERFEGFRFDAIHQGEIAWSENADNKVDIAYRKLPLTARKAFGLFGKNAGENVLEALEENPEKKFDFIHCIKPRDVKDVAYDQFGMAPPKKRPIGSYYVNKTTGDVVEEGGFFEFPIHVVRWETSPGEVYGRGPGGTALPDIRTLNKAKELYLRAMARTSNPPWLAQEKDIISNFDLRPGQVTVVRDINGFREVISSARFDVSQLNFQELQQSIQKSFFLDKLLLPPRTETGEMTAFEIQQRVEQMQRVLGPTLGRLNNELLQPLIVRAFKILLRAGQLGEVPQIIQEQGLDIEIEFVNQLARAQKAQDVSAIQSWAQLLGGIAQLGNPAILDYLDHDFIAKHIGRILGVPEGAIANDKLVQQIRQQRNQQMMQQQQLEQQVMAADVISKTGGGNGESQQ